MVIFQYELKESAEQIFTTEDASEAYCYCRDGILRVLDLIKGILVAEDKLANPFSSIPIFYDPLGSVLIGGRNDGTVFAWNRSSGVRNFAIATKAIVTLLHRVRKPTNIWSLFPMALVVSVTD